MRLLVALLGLLPFVPLASVAGTVIALPVARGLTGNGPWTIEVWPYGGCKSCTIDQADVAGVNSLLHDLLDGQAAPATREMPVTKVGVSDSQGEDSSLANLREALSGCHVVSGGILSPNHVTNIVAYGVQVACPKSDHPQFLSVVIGKTHTPVAVFWMPDQPTYAMDAN